MLMLLEMSGSQKKVYGDIQKTSLDSSNQFKGDKSLSKYRLSKYSLSKYRVVSLEYTLKYDVLAACLFKMPLVLPLPTFDYLSK